MLNWLLIISITLVSTTMLMFVSEFLAILPEAQQFYSCSQWDILLLSNSFNICYIIIAPFLFPYLKKYYFNIVTGSVVMTLVGCTGRYLIGNNYYLALLMTALVAIAQIPVITAPYGLLQLFDQSKRGYAASIPLFVPNLGSNFSIIYGMSYIADQLIAESSKQQGINSLNLIIAVVGTISCFLTILIMVKLKAKIKELNQQMQVKNSEIKTKGNFTKIIKNQFKGDSNLIVMLVSWGVILGISWTYGDMFGVFLNDTKLSHKQVAMVGLFANLSTVIFSNLGNFISNLFNFSNHFVIFNLNIVGFMASLVILASTTIEHELFQNKLTIIVMIIILKAGFGSFVSLALNQLSHCGPSLLVSSIFFYIANISNLGGNYLVGKLLNSQSLTVLSLILCFCIYFVYVAKGRKNAYQKIQNKCKFNSQQLKQQVNQQPVTNKIIS